MAVRWCRISLMLNRCFSFHVDPEMLNRVSAFDLMHKSQHLEHRRQSLPKAYYGGRHTVTMIPGGGIGPELMEYVRQIFNYTNVPVDFEQVDLDPKKHSDEDLAYAITSIRRNGVCIKGNIETSIDSAMIKSPNVTLRKELDLYVNVLNFRSYAAVPSKHTNVDVVIVRQNTEGEYAMLEYESVPGIVSSMKIITLETATRVARFAFELAKRKNRKKVTTVHKANIMKLGDGLFLETARHVSKDYPEILHDDIIIDNCCMQLVSNPHQFDIINTMNLYGSIISHIVSGLSGGAGLFAGRNYGDNYAVFEPGTRSTGSTISGNNVANPVAMLNASVDMLHHLGHCEHAECIRKAIITTLNQDKLLTPDLGGTTSSSDFIEALVRNLNIS